MAELTLTAQFDEFTRKTRQRATAVFREASEDLVEEMQKVGPSVANPSATGGGNMPVDTGFLRASLQANNEQSPLTNRKNPDPEGSFAYDAGPVSLVIAGSDLGQTIHVGYTATYAQHVENRYGFVRLAAMQWQVFVNRAAARVKAQATG